MMKTNPEKTNPCLTRRGIPIGRSGRNPKSPRTWLGLLAVASALALCPPSSLNAQTLLAGFDDSGTDAVVTALAANTTFTGITATFAGRGRQSATNSWGSGDETYGSTLSGAAASAVGVGAYRSSSSTAGAVFTITNNTGEDVAIEQIVFDHNNVDVANRDYWDAITLTYESGDLGVTDGTIINTVTGLPRDVTVGGISATGGDYPDFDWSLAGLTDFTLADGESATFKILSTATDTALANVNNAAIIDNIAFIGTVGTFVDNIPPVWAATYPKADTETTVGFTVRAKTNENGSAYYQILADGASTPTAAAVKAAPTGTIALTANTEGTALITGLSASTPYDVYVVAEDALGNLQADPLTTVNVTTAAPDTSAPNWAATYPQADTQTADGFTARAQIDENGTVYYVVVADGATAPTPTEVQAGTGSGGSGQLASGNFAVTANVEGTALVSGLSYTPGSSFDVYFVAVDGSSNATAATLVNWTPDTTPPTWTSGYPLVDTETEDGFTVRASIVGEGGKAYYVVVPDGDPAPSAAQVKAGQDANGDPALKNDSITAIVADTEKSKAVAGLVASTAYDVYVVIEDALFNLSAPVLRNVTTLATDNTVPAWTSGYPLVDTVTTLGFTVRASINEAGKAYYVVLANNSTPAPTAAQIKAGNDGSNVAALKSGNFILAANTENSAVVTGLAENTSYDVYIVAEDTAIAKNTTAVELREATTPVSTLTYTPDSGIQYNDNASREVSVYAGNSYVKGYLDGTIEQQSLSLGTILEYKFFNGSNKTDGYAPSTPLAEPRIGAVSTDSTASSGSAATAVYTTTDPTVGPANFTSDTNINGISSVSGSIDVTGLTSGTLYFLYGTNGTRNTSFVVTQGISTVQIAGNAFWDNGDTISAATPVAFTNDGSNNTISYSYTQTGAGKFMGVILSSGGGGTYADWASTNVGGDAVNVDTNGDGVDNGIAYFMDDAGVITLPGIVGGTVTWINGGNIAETQYGTQFVVQTSPDLVTWTDVVDTDPNLVNTAGSVAYTLPTGAGKLFSRLVVTPN